MTNGPTPPDVHPADRPHRSWSIERRALSRRGILALATASVGALCTTAAADARTPALRRTLTAPYPSRSAVPAPTPSATPSAAVPAQADPIFTLSEYRAVVAGPAFPANAVALTIDDGPHPVWTPKILDLLDRHHVPATFCLIGNQVLGHETVARNIVTAGHHIANHSYNHPMDLAGAAPARMREELDRTQEKIHSATGYTPHLFRSPGGAWSPDLLAQTAQAGMTLVNWSNDPKDWQRPGTATITQRLLAADPGDILLCHDGGGDRSQTYAALQTVIPALQARGYTFVAL